MTVDSFLCPTSAPLEMDFLILHLSPNTVLISFDSRQSESPSPNVRVIMIRWSPW